MRWRDQFSFQTPPNSWHPPPRPTTPELRAAALLLAISLVCLSLWFVTGDLGFWNDDFFLRQFREDRFWYILPAPTPLDAPLAHPWMWRPFLTIGVTTLLTHAWDSPWLVRAVIAGCHLATTGMLYLLLRRLAIARPISLGASLLYLCLPQHFEVAFWANGFLTGVATGFVLGATLLYLRWARGHRSGLMLLGFAACAAGIAASNEQPAGALIALPLLYWAFRSPTCPWRATLIPLAIPLIVMLLVLGLFVGVQLGQQADAGLGGAGRLTPPQSWAHNWLWRLREALGLLRGELLGWDALRLGLSTLSERPLRTALLALPMLAAGMLTLWSVRRVGLQASKQASTLFVSLPMRQWLIILAGLAMALGSLIPLALVESHVRPRMLSPMLAGLLLALAVFCQRCMHRWPPVRWLIAAVACAALGYATISMVGLQRAYELRWQTTQRLAASLRDLCASLPPHSLLMPLRCDDWPVPGDQLRGYFSGPMYWSFSFDALPKHSLQRRDVHASFVSADVDLAIFVTPTHVLRPGPFAYDTPNDGSPALSMRAHEAGWTTLPPTARWIAWERIVPCVVRPDGALDLVTTIAIRKGWSPRSNPPSAGVITQYIVLPRARRLVSERSLPDLTWVVDLPRVPEHANDAR